MGMTADGLRLTAYGLGRMRRQKRAGAVSRKPMASPALAYESYGLAGERIRITEGASVNPAGRQHGRRTQVPKVTAIENQAATGLRR
jgi:hypothetical protein